MWHDFLPSSKDLFRDGTYRQTPSQHYQQTPHWIQILYKVWISQYIENKVHVNKYMRRNLLFIDPCKSSLLWHSWTEGLLQGSIAKHFTYKNLDRHRIVISKKKLTTDETKLFLEHYHCSTPIFVEAIKLRRTTTLGEND